MPRIVEPEAFIDGETNVNPMGFFNPRQGKRKTQIMTPPTLLAVERNNEQTISD